MPPRFIYRILPFIFLISGCAHAPVDDSKPKAPLAYITDDLQTYESLHFKVRARNYERILEISGFLEEIYQRVMFDTNLFSFKPKENYLVTIYRDRDEYSNKTGYPFWSGGGTVTETLGQILPSEKDFKARSSIVTFEDASYPALLAHETTHLVFNEFMEFKTVEEAQRVLWLNEGLATFEEINARGENDLDFFLKTINPILRRQSYRFSEMIQFRPLTQSVKMIGLYKDHGEQKIYTNVDLWYWQVRSVVDFLISRHGSWHFFLLLNSLKRGEEFPTALHESYPGKWRSLEELENEWKSELKIF